ncbi:MAG: hypothetical protein LPK88_07040 [Alphaproteobacteria bacterium]|nr:hypothetical protein [Alphaproteobacteria bacterium]
MSLHDTDISQRLERYLARRAMPRRLEGKPEAQDDELRALVSAVRRFAPAGKLHEWWPKLEDALVDECTTPAWPTEREIRAAAQAVNRDTSGGSAPVFDTHEIMGRRMERGDAVPESFLYGREAVEMIARGLVDEVTMRKYRSAAYFRRKDLYGETEAQRWEDEGKQRHDDAKRIRRERAA